jgi:hypothetical protein
MRKQLGFIAIVAGLCLALVVPIAAHHAFAAEFDSNKPVKLQGTVAKVEMVNPHSWIYIDVKNPDGTTSQWMVEGGSPNALVRRGFTKDTLPKGTEVIFDPPAPKRLPRTRVRIVRNSKLLRMPTS